MPAEPVSAPPARGDLPIAAFASVLAAAAALALWRLHGASAALALAAGALLSLLNFAWLKSGAEAFLAAASGAPVNRPIVLGALRFFARFLLLLLCLCAIFISHLLPFAWVVAGLFAVPAGALLAGIGWLAGRGGGTVA